MPKRWNPPSKGTNGSTQTREKSTGRNAKNADCQHAKIIRANHRGSE